MPNWVTKQIVEQCSWSGLFSDNELDTIKELNEPFIKKSPSFDCIDEILDEKVIKMHPLNLQNHGFHSEGIQNPGFSRFLENTPKRTSRDPPGEVKWRPKSLLGRVKMLKNDPRTFPEPPRPKPMNFFSAPEASRSPPGSIFIAKRSC